MRRNGLPAGFFGFAGAFFGATVDSGAVAGAAASVLGSFIGVLIASSSEGYFCGDFDEMEAAAANDDTNRQVFSEALRAIKG